MARRRSITRNVMNRAWNIARNAMNAHNSNPQRIAQSGAATSILEFFSEALSLAWREVKSNSTVYRNVQSIPRKVMPRIHAALKSAYQQNPNLTPYEATMVALIARFGSADKVPDGMVDDYFQGSLAV